MPLPEGIYADPEVRRAWIEERLPVLEACDRLVATGMTTRRAARQVGQTHTGIRQIRASVKTMDGRLSGRALSERIDLGLALLSVANPGDDMERPREALTARDIVAWCGCSHAAIQSIERRALRKVHRRLNALLREQVVSGDFGGESNTAALAFAAEIPTPKRVDRRVFHPRAGR